MYMYADGMDAAQSADDVIDDNSHNATRNPAENEGMSNNTRMYVLYFV